MCHGQTVPKLCRLSLSGMSAYTRRAFTHKSLTSSVTKQYNPNPYKTKYIDEDDDDGKANEREREGVSGGV